MTANLEALRARIDDGSVAYWSTLGIVVDGVDDVGCVRLSLPMRMELGTRRPDVMHGGAIASLIDAAAGAAVLTLREDADQTWTGQATLDMNVTFLNAAFSDIAAEATVLRSTRTLAFVGIDVRDEAGALLAVGRATYAIMRSSR
ncbi:MAG: PaaI family thioesterase [Chloroflexi bacterium]|nr:PaaI family thioesterase [Chloroflexota bacterium]